MYAFLIQFQGVYIYIFRVDCYQGCWLCVYRLHTHAHRCTYMHAHTHTHIHTHIIILKLYQNLAWQDRRKRVCRQFSCFKEGSLHLTLYSHMQACISFPNQSVDEMSTMANLRLNMFNTRKFFDDITMLVVLLQPCTCMSTASNIFYA